MEDLKFNPKYDDKYYSQINEEKNKKNVRIFHILLGVSMYFLCSSVICSRIQGVYLSKYYEIIIFSFTVSFVSIILIFLYNYLKYGIFFINSENIKNYINEKLVESEIISESTQSESNNFLDRNIYDPQKLISYIFKEAVDRINREVSGLNRKGNINLLIGLTSTILGALFLVSIVFL